ncbi:hypothetical protein ACFWP7_31750 [Streptomyces sp. NPDC058470]|uniref:hypothetical protein n=1 Tax=Streptomyces sp. NPDC058470 TaxID=3346515 RepID=UPI00364ECD90
MIAMRNALRQTAARVGSEALALTGMAVVLVVGGVTADLAYNPLRQTLSAQDSRIGAAVLALILGFATYRFLDWVTDPITKRLNDASYDRLHRGARTDSPAPADTLEDGIDQIADAAARTASDLAAFAAGLVLDSSESSFLTYADRWQGFENGEARLYLAPGVQLYFRDSGERYDRRTKEFTLLTGDADEPVTITSLPQLHQHLTARAAGLPVAVAVDDTDGDTRGLSAA